MYTENTDEYLSVSPLYIDTFQFLLHLNFWSLLKVLCLRCINTELFLFFSGVFFLFLLWGTCAISLWAWKKSVSSF